MVAMFVLFLAACSSKKDIIETPIEDQSAQALVDALYANHSEFDWFKAKIDVDYKNGEEDASFEIHIKVRSDSIIYMTIRKFDVTAAKVLLEVDSVTFLNTGKAGTEKFYTIQSYGYLNEIIGASVDYALAQDLIFANANGLDSSDVHVTQMDSSRYYLSTESEEDVNEMLAHVDVSKGKTFRQYWLDPATSLLTSQRLVSIVDTTSLVMNYSEHELFGDISFPLTQEMIITTARSRIILRMTYAKIEFNEPQKVVLTIPDGYERR